MLINGEWTGSSDSTALPSYNPATGEINGEIPAASEQDVDRAVETARACFHSPQWQNLTYRDRGEILRETGRLIMEQAVELAELETRDNGKPIKESSLIDIPSAAETFNSFASLVFELKGETFPDNDRAFSYTRYEPIGTVAQIIPWNYPLLMAAWKLAPALAAGNTVVLKPSVLTSLTALELGKILMKAGLPAGAVNIITGPGKSTGKNLVNHPGIDKIAFTGSTEAGKSIISGSAESITPLTLELGGKSPAIVFEDCDPEKTAGSILSSIFLNQGEMCVACSRLIVQKTIYKELLGILTEKAEKIQLGNGLEPTTDMGPLISEEHRKTVAGYVSRAEEEGAKLECGGLPEDESLSNGFFFKPTILSGISKDMEIWKEEVFGPVLAAIPFETEQEALDLANDTEYGLAASIWTRDSYRIQRLVKGIDAGTIWVNTYGSFSDEVPFGGVKKSGFGRELGREGLLSYCRMKSVTMDITENPLISGWYGA
jgi:acyl-CoA reductase-like NAD-dependent aldehyde dehydrogenase